MLRDPQDQLATTTVRVIGEWLAAGHDPADMAVLARVNSALLPVLVGLSESGIACESSLTSRVLDRTVILVALASSQLAPFRRPLAAMVCVTTNKATLPANRPQRDQGHAHVFGAFLPL